MTREQQRIAIETVGFCPHCRAGNDPVLKDTTWACGVRLNDTPWRTKECYKRQNARLNQRIKRLEEAGDYLCAAAAFLGWHDKIEAWNQAKEDKL